MTPDDDDRRDERLAQLLEVPPLDDVTRRRLVRRALDEPDVTRGRDRRRLVAIAAAAAVLVAGVVVTASLLRDGGGDTTTAGCDRTEKTDEPAAGAADEEAAAAIPPYVGDIGEISDTEVLRERLANPPGASPMPGEQENGVMFCTFTSAQLGTDGPLSASAAGTYQGAPAIVLVGSKEGVDTAFVFDQETCELRAEVQLV